MMDITPTPISALALSIVVSWVIWVTASLFNQRQEIALLRQIFEVLKEKLKS